MKVKQLLPRIQAALKAGQLDAAAKDLDEAKKLAPADPGVVQADRDLQAAQRGAATKLVSQGKAALSAKKWDDAVKALGDAVKANPADKEVAALLKEAQEGQKNQAEYAKQLDLGKKALAAKKWDDAIAAFNAALKAVPADAEAKKGLQAATDGKKATPDPMVEYAKFMDRAAALEKAQKYLDAVQAYQDALTKIPKDAKATAGAKKITDYNQKMIDGNKGLQGKKWADAAKAYDDALKLFPDSKEAKTGLQKAKDKKP
jgi:tetratricopeptide (TPR) repeat protein